jgi:hypothetical protein
MSAKRPRPNLASLQWLEPFDQRLTLRGLGWIEENRRAMNFQRLPRRRGVKYSKGVRDEMKSPAGVFLSFFSDSPRIAIRMELASPVSMNHMTTVGAGGAELYLRDGLHWHSVAVAKPPFGKVRFEQILIERMLPKIREYRLYLPLYKELEELSLGLEGDCQIMPAPGAAGRPIVFYGTSITQGGCANTPGSDFVSCLGRALDTEVINLGFSGSGKGEPEVARVIRELDAEIFVLDFFANAEIETLDCVLPEFIRTIREVRPTTPIVIMSSPLFDLALWNSQLQALLDRRRDIAMHAYLEGKRQGDRNLHFLDGHGLIPPGVGGTYTDGSHPTSYGFAIMAGRIAPQLRLLRLHAENNRAGKDKMSR